MRIFVSVKYKPMRTFLLADNQYITSKGVAGILNELSLSDQIIEIKELKDLQDKLRIYPDAVVVMDYTLFDFASMQQMLIIKEAAKESTWILFSAELSEFFLRQVLLADPTISVVMKNDAKEEIETALQNATYRDAYICDVAEQVLDSGVPAEEKNDKLTHMEKVVLHEIAMGKTTKEIAWEKHLSFHTVNSHRKNIFRKLEINNVHEAVKYAIRAGLIDIAEYYI
jgi:DNA-binding NarL/FixJ family response regulator